MCWLKRDIWKAGITITGMSLLLVLMVWVPVSAAGADEGASGFAGPGTVTVQATPTVDATVATLNKEKLEQEVQQLKNQNEPDPLGWLRTNSAILLSTLVVVIGGLIGLFRWFGDRRSERDKRAEERFQAAVTGLGDEKEGAKIGAAILLRTFLRPGYEQFYRQTFELAVANLRPVDRLYHFPPQDIELPMLQQFALQFAPVDRPHPFPLQDIESPSSLNQALTAVFKDSFRLVRNKLREEKEPPFRSEMLDARGVRLDRGYFYHADLEQAWLPQASLIGAFLYTANLGGAQLVSADLINADLRGANLQKADLSGARLVYAKLEVAQDPNGDNRRVTNLTGAIFRKAILVGVDLTEANLHEADLHEAVLWPSGIAVLWPSGIAVLWPPGILFVPDNQSGKSYRYIEPDFDTQKLLVKEFHLDDQSSKPVSEIEFSQTARIEKELAEAEQSGTKLIRTTLARADLSRAKFDGAMLIKVDLRGADLHDANIQQALTLVGTDLRGVKGLDDKQKEACKAKGAIIDEVPTTSSSQSPVPPPPPSQSNDAQAPPAPPAQESLPTLDTGDSSDASPKPDLEL